MTGLTLPGTSRTIARGRHIQGRTLGGWISRHFNPAEFAQWMLVICLALVLWPAPYGGRLGVVIVGGTSMEPTYMLGDAVVTWKVPVEVGDTILYRVPEGDFAAGAEVIHRVVGGSPQAWITQGDNKEFADDWMPSSGDVLGVAQFKVPLGGRVLAVMRSWWVIAALGAVGALLLLWPDPADEEPKRGRHLG